MIRGKDVLSLRAAASGGRGAVTNGGSENALNLVVRIYADSDGRILMSDDSERGVPLVVVGLPTFLIGSVCVVRKWRVIRIKSRNDINGKTNVAFVTRKGVDSRVYFEIDAQDISKQEPAGERPRTLPHFRLRNKWLTVDRLETASQGKSRKWECTLCGRVIFISALVRAATPFSSFLDYVATQMMRRPEDGQRRIEGRILHAILRVSGGR